MGTEGVVRTPQSEVGSGLRQSFSFPWWYIYVGPLSGPSVVLCPLEPCRRVGKDRSDPIPCPSPGVGPIELRFE